MCVGTVAFLVEKQPHSGGGPSLLSLLQQVQAGWHHSPHTDQCQTSRQIVLADKLHFCITQSSDHLPDYNDNCFIQTNEQTNKQTSTETKSSEDLLHVAEHDTVGAWFGWFTRWWEPLSINLWILFLELSKGTGDS